MIFGIFQPSLNLSQVVDCYWIIAGTDKFSHVIVPDGHPELIFHFGDPFLRLTQDGWQRQKKTLIAGQMTRPITVASTGRSGVFGIKFKPWGLWQVFGLKMKSLRDEILSGEGVSGAFEHIPNELFEANSDEQRLKVVDDFLTQALMKSSKRDRHWIEGVMTSNVKSVSEASKIHKVSERKLERAFDEIVGLTPGTWIRLIRFKKAFELLQQKSTSLVDVAYLNGYFDQSHLYKDFKAFSGQDPRSYISANHELANFLMRV